MKALKLIPLALVAALIATAVVVAGCGTSGQTGSSAVGEITTGTPEPWELSTPEDAVRSYLDWISYSYRSGRAEDSSPTMTADEGVRVDSYIELNRQKNQYLEQSLVKIRIKDVQKSAKKATVAASEDWVYRYVAISTQKPGPKLNASYETTYTLTKQDGSWVVESVVASATTPVE